MTYLKSQFKEWPEFWIATGIFVLFSAFHLVATSSLEGSGRLIRLIELNSFIILMAVQAHIYLFILIAIFGGAMWRLIHVANLVLGTTLLCNLILFFHGIAIGSIVLVAG